MSSKARFNRPSFQSKIVQIVKSCNTCEPVPDSSFSSSMRVFEEFKKRQQLELEEPQSPLDPKKVKLGNDTVLSFSCLEDEDENDDPIESDSRFRQRREVPGPGPRILRKKEYGISKNGPLQEVNNCGYPLQLVGPTKTEDQIVTFRRRHRPSTGLVIATEPKDNGCGNDDITVVYDSHLNSNAITHADKAGTSGDASLNSRRGNVIVVNTENNSGTLSACGASAADEETEGGESNFGQCPMGPVFLIQCVNGRLAHCGAIAINHRTSSLETPGPHNRATSPSLPVREDEVSSTMPALVAESNSPIQAQAPASSSAMPFLGQPILHQYGIRALTSSEKRVLRNQKHVIIGALNINGKIHLISRSKTTTDVEQS